MWVVYRCCSFRCLLLLLAEASQSVLCSLCNVLCRNSCSRRRLCNSTRAPCPTSSTASCGTNEQLSLPAFCDDEYQPHEALYNGDIEGFTKLAQKLKRKPERRKWNNSLSLSLPSSLYRVSLVFLVSSYPVPPHHFHRFKHLDVLLLNTVKLYARRQEPTQRKIRVGTSLRPWGRLSKCKARRDNSTHIEKQKHP